MYKEVKKRNRYTAVECATVIQRSKRNRYTSVSRQMKPASFTALAAGEGTPPVRGVPSPSEASIVWREDPLPLRVRNGRRSSRHTGVNGGGGPRQTMLASLGEGTPLTGGGPLAEGFLRGV